MNKAGEIIVVDDDQDDCELFSDALKAANVPNRVICFHNPLDAITYLEQEEADPFVIFSDLRMSPINGFEFKQMIFAHEGLVKMAVPFILFSNTIDSPSFNTALAVGVQGFFCKPSSFNKLTDTVSLIINYFKLGFGD